MSKRQQARQKREGSSSVNVLLPTIRREIQCLYVCSCCVVKVCLFCGSLPPACRPFSVSCLPVLMMQHTAMLPFQNEIVQDLTAANTLCIVGSGIGWTRPVTAFLHTRAVEQNGGCHSPGVLGAPNRTLEQEVRRGDPTGIEPVDATKGRVSASDRQTLYKDGRCCHLTRLMLLNDLLEHQVDPGSFPGLFLFNAENVLPNSVTEFALSLCCSDNTSGLFHALSDKPFSFEGRFTEVPSFISKRIFIRCRR